VGLQLTAQAPLLWRADATPLPSVGRNAASGSLELRFNRFPERTDITLTVEGADSVAGPWTGLARSVGAGAFSALIAGVSISESGNGAIQAVAIGDSFPLPNASQTHRFLRLRATR
jgi:hypothetical protein